MKIAFLGHACFILTEDIKQKIIDTIKQLASVNEKVYMYLGGYGNFDYECLTILKDLKKSYSSIIIIFVSPYLNSNYYKLKTANLLYDETIYPPIENTPPKYAISKRNNWIVDNCDFLICYINKKYGFSLN